MPKGLELELVARAADITTPEALFAARDRLGAKVSVVIGKHAKGYHPKLWLFRSDETLSILSGSGNLTGGGITTNDEQFEVIRLDVDSDEAKAHEERFAVLTARAVSLNDLEGTTIWAEWLAVMKAQSAARRQIQQAAANFDKREVILNRHEDKQKLLADLDELYDLTVAAQLPRKDGQPYYPTRFKQGVDRARDGGDPVELVTRMCRRQTEGFDVILNAERPELTVEYLVLDESKPYYDLFSPSTRKLSAERLQQFPSLPS